MTNEVKKEKKELTLVDRARNAARNPEKLATLLTTCDAEQRAVVIRVVNGLYNAQADKLKRQGKTVKTHSERKTKTEKAQPFDISRGMSGVKKYLVTGKGGSAHDIEQALKNWTDSEKNTLKTLTDSVVNVSQHFFIDGSKAVLVKTEKANALNVGWVLLDCRAGLITTIFPPYVNKGAATDPVNTEERKKRMNAAKNKAVAYAQAIAEVIAPTDTDVIAQAE